MIVKVTFNSSNPFISVTQGSPIYVRVLQGVVSGGSGASDWADITNKPSTFTPSAHTHVIGDVTGLQAALDGKQASGSYANASHSHAIADVTGLQTALDSKQPTGSYATTTQVNSKQDTLVSGTNIKTVNGNSLLGSGDVVISAGGAGTWGSIGGTLSNQTDLQSALNAKANTSHSHVISDVTGLQTALDSKQASGSYAAASHSHVIGDITGLQTALDGKASSTHTHAVADVTGLQGILDTKQPNLVSGSNIKTVNGESIVGSGNVVIPAGAPGADGEGLPAGGNDGDILFKLGATDYAYEWGALSYPQTDWTDIANPRLFIQQTQPTPTSYSYQWNQIDSNGDLITIWHFKP